MDPFQTWQNLLTAWCDHDWEAVKEAAESLLCWLKRGGFSPEPLSGPQPGPLLNEVAVRAVTARALELANEVLASSNGIPHGVPFILSCRDCDRNAPVSFAAATVDGWRGIEFCPERVAENFLGHCPDHVPSPPWDE